MIQRQTGTNLDKLKYAACSIEGCFTVSTNATEEYYYGTDFTLDVNGNIVWTGTHKPADKQVYSVYYKFKPVFRVIKAVHRDRYTQDNIKSAVPATEKKVIGENTYVKLPETWVIKRDYLLERRDENGQLLPKNTYYDPNGV